MDEAQRLYVKLNKPDTKGQIMYDSTYIRHWSSKIHRGSGIMSSRIWGWCCAELGDWDWHVYTDVYKIDD